MSSSKKESVKGKIERTAGGARVMGLHTSSSSQSKKNSRTPSKKHYKSRATPMQNPEAPVPEEVSNTSVSANVEDDVATLSDKPAKEVSLSKDSSSSSKSSDSKAANSMDVLSEESMKTPPTVHDVSDDEDSEDVPLASVAARMLNEDEHLLKKPLLSRRRKPRSLLGLQNQGQPMCQGKASRKLWNRLGRKPRRLLGKSRKFPKLIWRLNQMLKAMSWTSLPLRRKCSLVSVFPQIFLMFL